MAQFKSEYLKCVPQFDGNPNELNRYLSTCESLISHFYDPTNPNNFENIYLLNSLVSKLTGNARLVTNIQSVTTWEELKDTPTRNFADQRDEACLNRDLVLLRQYQNEKPQQFFDRCLQILNLLCSYVDAHEATADAKVLKRNLYNNLALNTFLAGVREPLGTTLRCMRPTSMTQALQFIIQEENVSYFQSFTNKPYNKYASAQNKPPAPSQKQNNNFHNSHPTQQFGFQNQNNFGRPQNNFVGPQTNFGRFQNTFSNQPSQFQNRVNNQSQGFSRNSQMFRPPQQNVFKPNQNNQNFPKPTPMSVSTRQTSSNNVRQPMRPPYQYQPQQRNFTFEELHNAELHTKETDGIFAYMKDFNDQMSLSNNRPGTSQIDNMSTQVQPDEDMLQVDEDDEVTVHSNSEQNLIAEIPIVDTPVNHENNPGLLPLKIGQAKVQDYTHTFIHYYDLNPVIVEINKLYTQSDNLLIQINSNLNYSQETSNYAKILNLTRQRVQIKLNEIIPHSKRTKRGIINGLGSIFKSITGNLDASDGERYDRLINEIQNNQQKLSKNIVKQNSISLDIIDKFNQTIQQISHNENLLKLKILQIATIVEQSGTWKKSIFIKDILLQIINMFEILNSILQDIENSIAFSKLNVMHPSIIKTVDFYNELLKLQNQSQFKTIIPKDKFLLKNELYYAYESNICTGIMPSYYVCKKLNLKATGDENPCEIQLLQMKNKTTCQQIQVVISNPQFRVLDETAQWIGIFPQKEVVNLKCRRQEEILKLYGTFIIDIPTGCQISTPNKVLGSEQQTINNNQVIFFPELEEQKNDVIANMNLSIQLEDAKLDELQDIKQKIIDNQPNLSFIDKVSHIPSVWTLIVYVLIIIVILYFFPKED
ncbi:hypothetical protein NQ317_005245 [Molorchus minor]|uniref:Uncharacterized protein n=1 Tax=Molorchus minor TaxID=1323400 RepID=A0ABQ9JHF0_9CUCU|nr:hypothetical protein NQ317_005245 [Molorchus minor]